MYYATPYQTWHPTVLACYLAVLIMNLTCRLPRRACDLLLVCLTCVVRVTGAHQVANEIPKTLHTVLSAFDIDPRTVSYTCCPECFALYPDKEPQQSVCTNKIASDSPPCGSKLLRKRTIRGCKSYVPIKKYLHQGMKEWLGRMLQRPGLEDLMERTTNDQNGSIRDPIVADILGSNGLRSFLGPDGKPFMVCPEGESRYIFSFSADGFNPLTNIQGKQTASSTGMYLICLNLPHDLQNRTEFMYLVGVIPGPNKPSLTEMNHFLDLLAADLLDFWQPGVVYTRTTEYTLGRRVRTAIIPVVCDALGAHQVMGFGSINSTFFCTYCYLRIQDLENFEKKTWQLRNAETHRRHATQWLQADTTKCLALFQETGVRWSSLLRLPYIDPIRFTVVDTMHNLYLGLLETHCRDIWGMNLERDNGDGTEGQKISLPNLPPDEKMKEGRLALILGNKRKLLACGRAVLWYLCEELDLHRAGTKGQLLDALIKSVMLLLYHINYAEHVLDKVCL